MCLGHGTKNKVSDQFIFAKSKWIFSSLIKDYTNQTEHRMGFFFINLNTYLREVVFCEKKYEG